MKQYYKIVITETGRNSLKEDAEIFNEVVKNVATLEEAKKYIFERYGRTPQGRKKVYIGNSTEVGFIHSYWNRDYSHNRKSWFQTDWITVSEVTEKPILIK